VIKSYRSKETERLHRRDPARRFASIERVALRKLKPVHPGEILMEDFMKPHKLSMNRVAMDIRVPLTRIADIVAARRGITADTALRLGLFFGTSPEFWVNLQTRYDLDVAEDERLAEIERDVRPLESTPR
jgi:antitoxin HigA-1